MWTTSKSFNIKEAPGTVVRGKTVVTVIHTKHT